MYHYNFYIVKSIIYSKTYVRKVRLCNLLISWYDKSNSAIVGTGNEVHNVTVHAVKDYKNPFFIQKYSQLLFFQGFVLKWRTNLNSIFPESSNPFG